jgi:hypothetical protein
MRVWIHVTRDTPEVRDFLVANPVLAFRAQGGLEAVYFHDDSRPPRTHVAWKASGVHDERYVDLDRFLRGTGPHPGPRASMATG